MALRSYREEKPEKWAWHLALLSISRCLTIPQAVAERLISRTEISIHSETSWDENSSSRPPRGRSPNTYLEISVRILKTPKFRKQTLTDQKKEIDSNILIVGNFKSLLASVDWSPRQKINKETLALNDMLDQMDLQIYTEHSFQKHQNTHSSQVHREHSWGQKYVRPQSKS